MQAGPRLRARSAREQGRAGRAKISRNAALLTSRSGPRTSGLCETQRVAEHAAHRRALSHGGRAVRRPRRRSETTARAARTYCQSAGPSKTRFHIEVDSTQSPGSDDSGRSRQTLSAPRGGRAQTAAGRAATGPPALAAAAAAWRAAPAIGRFSSCRLPPCASAICRLSTRPIPEPPGLVVKNGTKRLPVFDEPGTLVLDPQLDGRRRRAGSPLPADAHAAAGLADGIDGVANQVDEQLLELIGVALDRQRGPAGDLDVVRLLERGDAIDERRRRRAARASAAAASRAARRRS